MYYQQALTVFYHAGTALHPEVYDGQSRVISDYRRSTKPHKEITDWREWQADAMAAALLLPKEAIEEAMFFFGLGDKLKVLSKKYSEYKYERFCEMAEFLQVSKTALAYRLEQLGLNDYSSKVKNYIVKPLGHMYMAAVTADDVKLALVPASKKIKLCLPFCPYAL